MPPTLRCGPVSWLCCGAFSSRLDGKEPFCSNDKNSEPVVDTVALSSTPPPLWGVIATTIAGS